TPRLYTDCVAFSTAKRPAWSRRTSPRRDVAADFAASRRRSAARQLMIAAAKKEQGAPFAGVGTLDLADVDGVIAGVVRGDDAAFDVRQRALENRRAGAAAATGQVDELVAARHREPARQLLLMLVEDVHDEHLRPVDRRIALRALVDAHEDERRIERDRGNGVRGQS